MNVAVLNHTGLMVHDIDAAVVLFRDLLGMTAVAREKKINTEFAFLEDQATHHRFELARTSDKMLSGKMDHISWAVDDVDTMFRRLKQSGLEPETQPVTMDSGFPEKNVRTRRYADLRDPVNGFVIQLIRYG